VWGNAAAIMAQIILAWQNGNGVGFKMKDGEALCVYPDLELASAQPLVLE
jgi:hypothetical protein